MAVAVPSVLILLSLLVTLVRNPGRCGIKTMVRNLVRFQSRLGEGTLYNTLPSVMSAVDFQDLCFIK